MEWGTSSRDVASGAMKETLILGESLDRPAQILVN
jgi:hypothetical protein